MLYKRQKKNQEQDQLADIDQAIGQRVRAIRKNKKLSLKELSAIMGISFTYLGSLERGERRWTMEMIDVTATALEIPKIVLQAFDVPVAKIVRVSEIITSLSKIPDDKLEALEQLIAKMAE